MTLWTVAGTSFLLGFSGAIMPGPLLSVTIAEAVRRGPWVGPRLILGHALLEAAVVAVLFFGLAEVIRQPAIFTAVALVGAVMLIWMGGAMLRGLPRMSLAGEEGRISGLSPVLAGAAVSLANPYFTLWWATIGIGYLAVAHQAGGWGVAVFYLFHILADLLWYSFVSGAVSLGRQMLGDRGYRALVGGCALFLIAFGGYFGLLGFRNLAG